MAMRTFRILIVDDNGSYRKILKKTLQRSFPAISIDEAASGVEAWEKIDTFLPDLIFMDILLPGENGLKLVEKIKVAHPSMIIFMITLYDTPEYLNAAFQRGAECFLPKSSFNPMELEELVKLGQILSESLAIQRPV